MEVYKVLIADDEYWTREKLRTIINWEEHSLLFMPPAVDGEDVLKKCESDCPNILITDIDMPFINGVELIRLIHEKYPEVVSIALSGYDDFDYVREALINGAIDYLLKPVSKIDLIRTISKALESISENRLKKESLLKISSALQDKELSMLLSKNNQTLSKNIYHNLDIGFSGYYFVLIKIYNISCLAQEYQMDLNLFSYTIKHKISEIMDSQNKWKHIVFNNINEPDEYIYISNTESGFLKERLQYLLNVLSEFLHTYLGVFVSGYFFSADNIRGAYEEAICARMMRKYALENQIVWFEQVKNKIIQKRITMDYENGIYHCLQTGNKKLLIKIIFEQIGIRECTNGKWVYMEVYRTVHWLAKCIAEVPNMEQKDTLTMENIMEYLTIAIEHFDVKEICSFLEQMINERFTQTNTYLPTETIKDTIKRIESYIDENYFEELTLANLSKRYMVESSYLSKAFKKETGDNLMVAIANKRIAKAIEFMKKGEMSLTQIAVLVGYVDYRYFNRVFNKITGKSPRDYMKDIEEGRR